MLSIKKKFQILTYNIGFIVKGLSSVMDEGINRGDICWLIHPYKDRFFADPFLFRVDEKYYYVLVEEYMFWEEKGKITLLTVEKESCKLINRKVIIEEPYHLSFPFCELNGDTVVTESVASGKTYEYTIDFNKQCITNKKEILSDGLIDAVFYRDKNGDNWILASHLQNPKEDLFLYKYTEHGYAIQNDGKPIMRSLEYTRGAGRFFEYKGQVFRPVQDSQIRYGRQTNIMLIESISDQGIITKKVNSVNSFNNPPFDETLHTFNVYDEIIIVDGSKDILRFPMKLFYKKCRFLFK